MPPEPPNGDQSAADPPTGEERERGAAELFELLHAELRGLAAHAMAGERGAHTLQPTALLNEVWLRLYAGPGDLPDERRRFLATAAKVMRQVLVDHARTRDRIKRGGAFAPVSMTVAEGLARAEDSEELDVVELDAALDELREVSPRQARVVELRFFGGLEVDEVAHTLELSPRTIAREWRFAKAWLVRRMGAGS